MTDQLLKEQPSSNINLEVLKSTEIQNVSRNVLTQQKAVFKNLKDDNEKVRVASKDRDRNPITEMTSNDAASQQCNRTPLGSGFESRKV